MIKKAFSLIELLVVIAIIGILAGVGVANFLTAQRQARDSSRGKIMLEIQSSFEQYFGEFGLYPTQAGANINDAFEDGTTPVDPKNSDDYIINWDNTEDYAYCICAKLETHLGNAAAPTSAVCNWDTTGEYFCVQNKQ